ncbi:hypothetical protein FCULG_00012923 [Fusarium culmorum]|uniref:Uncharacterized protein n=1 Tax=Fusarium culmorum TaxID=5516 RepID=A0A2T4GES6_FUSCU|nr:hypothetical protein FCULG_00012923 [Fusarium culmorum]
MSHLCHRTKNNSSVFIRTVLLCDREDNSHHPCPSNSNPLQPLNPKKRPTVRQLLNRGEPLTRPFYPMITTLQIVYSCGSKIGTVSRVRNNLSSIEASPATITLLLITSNESDKAKPNMGCKGKRNPSFTNGRQIADKPPVKASAYKKFKTNTAATNNAMDFSNKEFKIKLGEGRSILKIINKEKKEIVNLKAFLFTYKDYLFTY